MRFISIHRVLIVYNRRNDNQGTKCQKSQKYLNLSNFAGFHFFYVFLLDIPIPVHIIDVGNVPNIHQICSLFRVF